MLPSFSPFRQRAAPKTILTRMIHSQDRCAWLRHLRTSRTTLFSLRSTLIFGRSFPRRPRTCRVLLVERLREFLRLNYVTGAEVCAAAGGAGFDGLFLAPGRVS